MNVEVAAATGPGRLAVTLLLATLVGACAAGPSARAPRPVPAGAAASADWRPAVPEIRRLSNGAQLWLIEDHLLPLVSIRVVLRRGAAEDPPGQWGRAALAADMLNESAGPRSAVELAAELRRLAAGIGTSVGLDSLRVSLNVHAHRLDQALPLLADVILRPAFAAHDWERVFRRRLDGLLQERQDPSVLAVEVLDYFYYGEDHPMGRPIVGTPATLAAVTLELAEGWYREALDTAGVTFVVVGDIGADRALSLLESHFGEWRPSRRPPRQGLEAPAGGAGGRVLLVDVPGSTQTAIRVQGPGYVMGQPEFAGARLAATVLGGTFKSRLNQLMREEKGYTYGVSCFFAEAIRHTAFYARTSVEASATAEGLTDLLAVLRAAADGFSEDERQRAQARFRAGMVSGSETRSGLAEVYANRAALDLAPDGWYDELVALEAAALGDMAEAARRYLNPSAMLVVLAGDRSVIAESLRQAGYEVEVVEPPD